MGTETSLVNGDLQLPGSLSVTGAEYEGKQDVNDANYNPSALTNDKIIAFTALTTARTVTISTEDRDSGTPTKPRIFHIKDESGNCSPVNTITISLETAGNIEGAASIVLSAARNGVSIYIDGTNGFIFMTYITNPRTQDYGEMYWNNNAVATVIGTANTKVALVDLTTGLLLDWTYTAGVHGTDISAYATSDAGARTKVTTTGAHGLSLDDYITISATTNYNDIYQVMEIVDANNFTIDKAWDTNDDATGNYDRGDCLVAGAAAAGVYAISYNMSMSEGGGAGSIATIQAMINKTASAKSLQKRKFANNDVGNMGGGDLITIAAGDVFWMSIESTGTNNITISNGDVNIERQ